MQIEKEEIVLSVSEYVERLNVALGAEAGFVQGEVIGFKQSIQWIFFTLKDSESEAVLSCGLLAHEYKRFGVLVEDGMLIKIYGNPRITPKSGRFGVWVKSIEPVGEGSLKKAYELLVKKLTAEGLFVRKRPLPEFISRIGVISSRDGVVLQDLRKNLARLGMSLKFVHAPVEGAGAAPGILRAIDYFSRNSHDYDVVVIIRGGGSLESLRSFNNEEVARSLFGLPIAVIAGIGHDVDVPIAALVADAEGSTPTAVAHIINATWSPLMVGLSKLERELARGMQNIIYDINKHITFLEREIIRSLDGAMYRTNQLMARAESIFAIADPLRNLRLGYSITTTGGKVVKRKGDVKMGETLETRVADGVIKSQVTQN